MRKRILWLAVFLITAVLLSACEPSPKAPATSSPQPTATASPSLTPLPTTTPTRLATNTPRPSATKRPSPTTSATYALISSERVEAPILLYHHVASSLPSDRTYTVGIKQFRAQMELLQSRGYHPITTTVLAAALRGEGGLPERPALIVFDDGYEDVYQNAFPILTELGYPATMNVITKSIDGPSYLSADELRALSEAGWEIGSHSQTHANLVRSGDPIGEVCLSKRGLEKILGQQVFTFAYPYGAANPYVIQIVKDCGYTSGGGVGPFTSHTLKSIYFLSRVTVDGSWTLDQFYAALIGQLSEQ